MTHYLIAAVLEAMRPQLVTGRDAAGHEVVFGLSDREAMDDARRIVRALLEALLAEAGARVQSGLESIVLRAALADVQMFSNASGAEAFLAEQLAEI